MQTNTQTKTQIHTHTNTHSTTTQTTTQILIQTLKQTGIQTSNHINTQTKELIPHHHKFSCVKLFFKLCFNATEENVRSYGDLNYQYEF